MTLKSSQYITKCESEFIETLAAEMLVGSSFVSIITNLIYFLQYLNKFEINFILNFSEFIV